MANLFKKAANYPFDIKGIVTKKSGREPTIGYIETENIPELETLYSLFGNLPKHLKIFFFDNFFPTISDPGAYVSVGQMGGRFYYRLGNHGWSSDEYWTTAEYCSRYLLKNWKFNKEGLPRIDRNPGNDKLENIEKEKIWDIQLKEVESNNRNYILYEVNGNLLLSVLLDDDRLFKLNILLNNREQIEYEENGKFFLEKKFKDIQDNQALYSGKSIEIRRHKK